jgi:hypothetical protein
MALRVISLRRKTCRLLGQQRTLLGTGAGWLGRERPIGDIVVTNRRLPRAALFPRQEPTRRSRLAQHQSAQVEMGRKCPFSLIISRLRYAFCALLRRTIVAF